MMSGDSCCSQRCMDFRIVSVDDPTTSSARNIGCYLAANAVGSDSVAVAVPFCGMDRLVYDEHRTPACIKDGVTVWLDQLPLLTLNKFGKFVGGRSDQNV